MVEKEPFVSFERRRQVAQILLVAWPLIGLESSGSEKPTTRRSDAKRQRNSPWTNENHRWQLFILLRPGWGWWRVLDPRQESRERISFEARTAHEPCRRRRFM